MIENTGARFDGGDPGRPKKGPFGAKVATGFWANCERHLALSGTSSLKGVRLAVKWTVWRDKNAGMGFWRGRHEEDTNAFKSIRSLR